MVNSHLPAVNAHLLGERYGFLIMAKTVGKKRGPKKGTPKPIKRMVDAEFPDRLLQAMARRGLIKQDGSPANSELAKLAGCTRQVIGQYLDKSGSKKTLDAILLMDLCDALWVTPYWLAKNEGGLHDVAEHHVPLQELRRKQRA